MEDAGDARRALYEEMVERMYEHGKAVNTASHFELDDVIDPADSRHWIANALRSSPPLESRRGKKLPAKPAAAPQQKAIAFKPEEVAPAELPPVNLLCTDSIERVHDEAELVHLGEVIRESAAHFGIEGTIEGHQPRPGDHRLSSSSRLRASRSAASSTLQDDLALALKAESVRIERLAWPLDPRHRGPQSEALVR